MRDIIKRLLRKQKINEAVTIIEVIDKKTIRRQILIDCFFRNHQLIKDFKLAFSRYCDITGTWNSPAFADSNLTNRAYYETLKQVSDEEYSFAQCEAVKTIEIHKLAVEDYIRSLDTQYKNLKSLYDQLIKNEGKFPNILHK